LKTIAFIIKTTIMIKFQNHLLLFFFINFLALTAYSQKRVFVTTANFAATGWVKGQTNRLTEASPITRKDHTDLIYITCEPDNRGSAYLSFPNKTKDPTLPNSAADASLYRVILGNTSFHGTRVIDLAGLSFFSYTEKNAFNTPDASGTIKNTAVGPVLLLQVDINGDGSVIDNINFELQRQGDTRLSNGKIIPAPKVNPGEWQEWDAFDGWWWYVKRDGTPPPIAGVFTLETFLKSFPNAIIVNTPFEQQNGGAGVRFLLRFETTGNYDDFRGYIDQFKITTKAVDQPSYIYDFTADCIRKEPVWWWRPWMFVICGLIVAVVGFLFYRGMRIRKAGKV
jgi:hypothetical protein